MSGFDDQPNIVFGKAPNAGKKPGGGGGGGGGTQTGTGMSAAKLDAETEELKRARRAPREPRPLLRRTPAAPTSRLPPASR